MIKLLIAILLFGPVSLVCAQDSWTPLDNSPMDLIYCPIDYPVMKIRKSAPAIPVVKIMYSRPIKKNRKIFGELIEYGTVWRLGANEATELDLFKDVKIAGTKLKKGNYTMYAIPYKDKWTIIINKDTDVWGAFAYDKNKDVLRIDVKTEDLINPVEAFTMMFEPNPNGANLLIAWENTKVTLPIQY